MLNIKTNKFTKALIEKGFSESEASEEFYKAQRNLLLIREVAKRNTETLKCENYLMQKYQLPPQYVSLILDF